jgi:hypothetical protein
MPVARAPKTVTAPSSSARRATAYGVRPRRADIDVTVIAASI